jgi:formylglycine-generating enzyme required for sulfatase activity
MEGNRLPALERAQAGINLAILGDPRFNPDLWHLPDDETLGFIHIPAGKFLMGSDDRDEDAGADEKPQHEMSLPDFWMSKYPVTVAQFRAFTETAKYSFDNWRWNQIFSCPIVYVSWYDALEYTKWLDKELRQYAEDRLKAGKKNPLWQGLAEGKLYVTLPSEAEWEKAARSTDGRIYPWGNEFDPDKANTAGTKIGDPNVVGCFPEGTSPYGLLDMSGNVWEWTRSIWNDKNKYPYRSKDGREDLQAKDPRVLRGGAFFNSSGFARCASRSRNSPDLWFRDDGFRVVVSLVLPS